MASTLLQTLYNRFYRPYSLVITVSVILVVFLVAAYYGYKWSSKKIEKKEFSNVANIAPNGATITIYRFWVDWCPHCVKSAPEWKSFSDNYNGKTVNGYVIECLDIDCTNDSVPKTKQLMDQFGVQSFPTVKAVKPDSAGNTLTIDFDAKVTSSNLEKYVQSLTTVSQ